MYQLSCHIKTETKMIEWFKNIFSVIRDSEFVCGVCVCVKCVTMVVWSVAHSGKYKLLSFVTTQGHPCLGPSSPLHPWCSCLFPLSFSSFPEHTIPFYQLLLMRFCPVLSVPIPDFKTQFKCKLLANFPGSSVSPAAALHSPGSIPCCNTLPPAFPGGLADRAHVVFFRTSLSARCVVHWRPQSFK